MLDARSVGHIASNQGQVATIRADRTAAEAAQVLSDRHVGCLIVVDEEGKIVGIVTERDLVRKTVAVSIDATDLLVREVMTEKVISCDFQTPIPDAQEMMAAHGIRHLPVVHDGRAVGMISSRDIIAHQMAANRAMQAAAEQVAMLSKGFKSLDYDEILHLVTREVPRIFGAEWGVLCFPARSGGDGMRVISRNVCGCSEKTLSEELVRDPSKSLVFCDLPEECEQLEATSPRTIFRLPIYEVHPDSDHGGREPSAYLCMCRLRPSAAASKELLAYKATLLQEILGVNLMNARLYERARRESQADPLTGLSTRRVFEERLEQEYERSLRYGHRFCVAIMDVDRFKSVNDSLGHEAGDRALRLVADMMHHGVRATDVLARYGGDEFVLLMPETGPDGAMPVLERLRAFAASALPEEDRAVTISCGAAAWSGDPADTGADVLRRADAALYEAKRTGRNRVVFAEPELVDA